MTDFYNCNPSDALGYPSYFRAVYQTGRFDFEVQLGNVVGDVVAKLHDSTLAVPINTPQPVSGDRVAVLDLRVVPEGQYNTVADLAKALDVTPFFGWWPQALSAVTLQRIERIAKADAYSDASREAERKQLNDQANNTDVWAKLIAAAKVLVVVLIVVAVVWGLTQAVRLKQLQQGGA